MDIADFFFIIKLFYFAAQNYFSKHFISRDRYRFNQDLARDKKKFYKSKLIKVY